MNINKSLICSSTLTIIARALDLAYLTELPKPELERANGDGVNTARSLSLSKSSATVEGQSIT